MEQNPNDLFFALLRSAICGEPMTERKAISTELLTAVLRKAEKHDLSNLIVLGLEENGLLPLDSIDLRKQKLKAVFRYEQLQYELDRLCDVLEAAKVPFVPMKGAVMRQYYREAWMRTSSDIDILVHREDLKRATASLERELQYRQETCSPHDISLYSPNGTHIELHFSLVEEGRARLAAKVLSSVWEYAFPQLEGGYRHVLRGEFFYFYHIAHMAKHFEGGGCGVRPFIDLWLLNRLDEGNDRKKCEDLLESSELLTFARAAEKLSRVWLGGEERDALSSQMEDYLLQGGVYGSTDNRVAAGHQKKGGKLRYLWSRIFLPYPYLKTQYPILERYGWLAPVMHLRRWCRLLKPGAVKRAQREVEISTALPAEKAKEVAALMQGVGLTS